MFDARATPPDIDVLDRVAVKALVTSLYAQIEHLKLVVAKLRRMHFGRKSEKLHREIEQLELQLEGLQTAAEQPLRPVEKQQPKAAPQRQRKKRALPGHLRREVHTHPPKEKSCPECGGALRKLGEDVSEVLEYIPASFFVIRHVRPKLSCARCSCVVQAAAPERPVDRGMAGPALLAHVLAGKYCTHLPLYRQSQIYSRLGVDLDRSTLAKWVGEASTLMEPLVEALRRYVMNTDKLHGDDTPLPVLAPGNGKPKRLASGPTYATTARRATRRRRRYGSLIRVTGEGSIRSAIWRSSEASCKQTPSQVSISFTKTALFRKRPASLIFGASSTT